MVKQKSLQMSYVSMSRTVVLGGNIPTGAQVGPLSPGGES